MADVTTTWWQCPPDEFYDRARAELPRMSAADDGKGSHGPMKHMHRLTAAQKRRLKELEA